MKIVIAGGTGQVGTMLARHFHREEVTVLSRDPRPAPWRVARWTNSARDAWARELDGADVLINLAGRSVNCRYTPKNRAAILDSRLRTTETLHHAMALVERPPSVWLNASTATIYRHSLDRAMDENSGEFGGNEPGAPPSWRFSVEIAKAWEKAFFGTQLAGTRQIALRSSLILSPDRGGIFDVLLRLVRFGLGGTNLPGTQFISWIHDRDFLSAVDFLIADPTMAGPINLAAPHPVPNRQFMAALRKAWGMPIGLPATPFMLETGAFFLRTESELVLKSRHVVPGRLLEAGFQFAYPTWPEAARDLVARWKAA